MKKMALMTLAVAITVSAFATTVEAQRGRRGGQQRGQRDDGGLKVGEMAPTFVLKSLDGSSQTDLASFRGDKPVVLFFGSYT